LPSGAVVVFAVAEREPPFFVPGRDGEIFGTLRHVLEGTTDRLECAGLERLEVGVQVGPLVVRRHISEGGTAGAITQNQGARGRAGRSTVPPSTARASPRFTRSSDPPRTPIPTWGLPRC
jgi:hypothetical protein